MGKSSDLVCLGALAGAWGIRGAVRLKSFCAVPEAIADYAPLLTEDGRSFEVKILRRLAGAFAAELTGVADREAAEALKGTRLYAPRDRLPELPEDEFYHADLVGLAVLDTGGAEIGRIKSVMDHGAGDLLEIARPGKLPLLLPFTRDVVPTVDLDGGRIVVDPPPGLQDEDDD
jgi:16S rRNA processing protein RimM